MHINDFDYELPKELIAQTPAEKRDFSRLMVVDRATGQVEHKHFYDILNYLNPGDCLVLNNSKVLPARIFGVKEGTGAKIEFLLTKRIEGDTWETMVRPGKRLKVGDMVSFSGDDRKTFKAVIKDYGQDGTRIVQFEYEGIFLERLEELGQMPLPPYIERENNKEDRERYQTVYCRHEGSVAAPTAGLHFTEDLLQKAEDKGVRIAYVTLHVGIGTFRPVKVENIEEHHMHFEEYFIKEESAAVINDTIKRGNRIVSVGTTSTRTVESAAQFDEESGLWLVQPGHGNTDIFIYPGYEFKIIDALITNFHLPKSTLLMLISALYNREDVLRVYKIAVEEKYRFFSYGDAMFIK
ncbi:MAG: tRNA preQ1(34) S-adenosylmethionine ribosyltransferase-isomerase QueA [Anaerovoracaceae bacterium]